MSYMVSIIIPTYNRYSFIGETLESIKAQLYQNWECIIVDDGSTDYTEELVEFYTEKDKRIRFYKRPESLMKGANNCRNYGFKLSRGKFINWFDDDDVILPEFISTKLKTFTPKVDVVICSFYKTDEVLKNRKLVNLEKSYSLYKSYALYELKIITHSVLFRREFLMHKNLFLGNLKWGEETELYLRLFYELAGHCYKLVNEPLFLYRQHKLSKSTHNRSFIEKLTSSSIFIAFENLKRGLDLEDKEIIVFFYKQLISLFFRSLEVGHKNNAKSILKNLTPLIFKINKLLSFELIILGNTFLLFNKGIYRVRSRWMYYLS